MQSPVNRRVKVTVNGKPYVVEVGDLHSSPINVLVNGQPYLVNIAAEDIEVLPADASAATLEKVTRKTSAPEKAPQPTGPAGPMVNAVKAPMPGNILEIAAKPGDTVTFRQQLCMLEAMKMKNAIRSPKDGIIATVEVAEGQTVAHNDVLFTFK